MELRRANRIAEATNGLPPETMNPANTATATTLPTSPATPTGSLAPTNRREDAPLRTSSMRSSARRSSSSCEALLSGATSATAPWSAEDSDDACRSRSLATRATEPTTRTRPPTTIRTKATPRGIQRSNQRRTGAATIAAVNAAPRRANTSPARRMMMIDAADAAKRTTMYANPRAEITTEYSRARRPAPGSAATVTGANVPAHNTADTGSLAAVPRPPAGSGSATEWVPAHHDEIVDLPGWRGSWFRRLFVHVGGTARAGACQDPVVDREPACSPPAERGTGCDELRRRCRGHGRRRCGRPSVVSRRRRVVEAELRRPGVEAERERHVVDAELRDPVRPAQLAVIRR